MRNVLGYTGRQTGRAALIAAAAGVFFASAAQAQTAGSFPQRPVRMVVPNLAGSATDVVARMVAHRFTEMWGQQVVVDNRAGASGVIGTELTARATPDGYTLMMGTSAALVIVPLMNKVPYDTLRDLTPVSLVVVSPQMLVSHPSVAAKNVNELLALARAQPGKLNCGSPGAGTSNHLGCEMLKVMGKVDFLHVPYKGASAAITDLVGGQVQFLFNSMPAVWPLAKAGKLRALAFGGTQRSSAAPDVPTVAESLPGFQCATWYALMAPGGMPPAVLAKINGDMVKMLNEPAFSKRILEQGQEPQSSSSAELGNFIREESKRWVGVIKAAGLATAR
ncbi:MAG: tripartite tricarboxylate transporter substrate binding protein [Betaproteobacteria bacterium]|nr:tripartite tricarboxylate transporter substrate binding protein [Betaproteobacteria bacterium]